MPRPQTPGGKSLYPKAKPFAPPPPAMDAARPSSNLLAILVGVGVLTLALTGIVGWFAFASTWNTPEPLAQNGFPLPTEGGELDSLPPAAPTTQTKPPLPKEKPPEKDNTKPSVKPQPPIPSGSERPEVTPIPIKPPEPEPPKTEAPLPLRPKVDPPKNEPPKNDPVLVVPAKPPGQMPVVLLPLEPLNLEQKPGLLPNFVNSNLKFNLLNFKVGVKGKGLRLAVTSPGWDDLGTLLVKLGAGYNYDKITNFDLVDPAKVSQYDVLFINCAPESLSADPRIYSTLRWYVQKGGTLYASDLRYHDLAKIFPEYTVNRNGVSDLQGHVQAAVADEGLKRILGPQVQLHFDLSHCPAAFNTKFAKVYLYTQQKNFLNGQVVAVPLLTKFQCGKGNVVYTSFHNSKQLSDVEMKLLMYIIFSTVNSEAETKAREIFAEKGFVAKEVKNLGLSQGYSLARQTFKFDGKGKLAVALGFRGDGAKLQLKIFAPDGKVIQHTDSVSFLLEIEDAPAGSWQYAVTAAEAPYDNFPFALIVGQSKWTK